jgi:hypothetical protein
MSNGIMGAFQASKAKVKMKMNWDENRLVFVVREPFLSKHSQVSIAAGVIAAQQSLTLESHMPFNGVIFSDGIETDFLKFNSGCQVRITLAGKKANMVQP